MQQQQHNHCRSTVVHAALSSCTWSPLTCPLATAHTHTHSLLALSLSPKLLTVATFFRVCVLCLQVLSFLPFLSSSPVLTAALREHRCNVPQVSNRVPVSVCQCVCAGCSSQVVDVNICKSLALSIAQRERESTENALSSVAGSRKLLATASSLSPNWSQHCSSAVLVVAESPRRSSSSSAAAASTVCNDQV